MKDFGVFNLLIRSLPGAQATKRAHIKRGERVAQIIHERWQVGPWQWRQKHALWFLQHGMPELSHQTRYDYWRTLQVIIVAIGKEAWLPRLQGGTWISPQGKRQRGAGGRPAKRPNRAGLRVRGGSTPRPQKQQHFCPSKATGQDAYPAKPTTRSSDRRVRSTGSSSPPRAVKLQENRS